MKLYYAPHACSLSPHIVLRELGMDFTLVCVDTRSKRTSEGHDFLRVNPKGYVAALELDDGEILTEGPAIVQYLADLRPGSGLAPAPGSWQRLRLQEWLGFVNSELHAGSAPLFHAGLPEAARAHFRERLLRRLDFLQQVLAQQPYLMGEAFGVADAYLFTVLGWLPGFGIALEHWPALSAYAARIARRPAVQAALRAEAEPVFAAS
ncbi:MAG: glutathione transferase GstA [Burkholderiaceae bacterium]|jgi:glutathione S-transferase|nr:glutathione transferase GstA [Burkholderiaceae bacterium]